MRRAAPAAAVVAAVLLSAACGVLPELPDPAPTTLTAAPAPTPTRPASLSPDGFADAQRIAVRVRNVGCSSLSTGSGFPIDDTTLVTNKHVVADSASLALSTYDGRDIAVTTAGSANVADLALVRTADPLPVVPTLADTDAAVGDAVTIVGYPGGGALTVTTGTVLALTPDPLNETLGDVMVTDAPVQPGSSGSAVLNAAGAVVGVVYAKDEKDHSYVVPISTLRTLLSEQTAFTPAPTCS